MLVLNWAKGEICVEERERSTRRVKGAQHQQRAMPPICAICEGFCENRGKKIPKTGSAIAEEEDGNQQFKLCTHHRHFLKGRKNPPNRERLRQRMCKSKSALNVI